MYIDSHQEASGIAQKSVANSNWNIKPEHHLKSQTELTLEISAIGTSRNTEEGIF